MVLQGSAAHPVACAAISYGGKPLQVEAAFTHALVGR